MAINTRTVQPINIKADRYQGISPLQQRLIGRVQNKFDTTQQQMNEYQALVEDYAPVDAELASDLEQEFQGELQGIRGNLKNAEQLNEVSRDFSRFRNKFATDNRLKGLQGRKQYYNLGLQSAANIKDQDTRAALMGDLNQRFQTNQYDEQGNLIVNPTEDMTYYDLPSVSEAAAKFAQLKQADSGATSVINGNTVRTEVNKDGTRSYSVQRGSSWKEIKADELDKELTGIIMNAPEVQGFLEQADRIGLDKEAYEQQFADQIRGVADLRSFRQTSVEDKIFDKSDVAGSGNQTLNNILGQQSSAGANQVPIPTKASYGNVTDLKSKKQQKDGEFQQIWDNIIPLNTSSTRVGAVGGDPQTGIPVPTSNFKSSKLKPGETYLMNDPVTGEQRSMTPNEINNYNLQYGEKLKVDQQYNNVVNTALEGLSISRNVFDKHENFISADIQQKEQVLGESYEDYSRRIEAENEAARRSTSFGEPEIKRPKTPNEWANDRYKDKFDFDISEVEDKMNESLAKVTYDTKNKDFVTYEGRKELIGQSQWNKLAPNQQQAYMIAETRDKRWTNNYQDMLNNAGTIISEKTNKVIEPGLYDVDEQSDFYEELFGQDIDVEKGVSFDQLGYNYDHEFGGLEKVEVTATNSDGEKVKTHMFVNNPEVNTTASVIYSGGQSDGQISNKLRNDFKKSKYISQTNENGEGYLIEQVSPNKFNYTFNYVDPQDNQLKSLNYELEGFNSVVNEYKKMIQLFQTNRQKQNSNN